MIDIPHVPGVVLHHARNDKDTGLGWWWKGFESDDLRFVIVRCPNGHDATLRNVKGDSGHSISKDGTVSPSIVCPYDGCDFHEFGKLMDWGNDG